MKSVLRKEIPIIGLVLLPFIYLAYIWNDLPEKVPLHWNIQGEIDRYGSKWELILITSLLPVFIYTVLLIIPRIDPKNKIKQMGSKYQSIKVILTGLISILALYILYSSKQQTLTNPNFIIIVIGILYMTLGNYFKTIKANYFIGIRTPWTLEDETVWKETHTLGGKLWFVGGFIISLLSLVLNFQASIKLFLIITGVITIIPIVFSYSKFKQIQKSS